MSQPISEYITARIGQTWTVEDAAYVADKIRQIEQVAEGVVRMNQNARKFPDFRPPRNRGRLPRGEGAENPQRLRISQI